MSQLITFYFTSSMLSMFRTLIQPSSGACYFSIVSPHGLCVLVSTCVGVSVWLVGVVSVWQASATEAWNIHIQWQYSGEGSRLIYTGNKIDLFESCDYHRFVTRVSVTKILIFNKVIFLANP